MTKLLFMGSAAVSRKRHVSDVGVHRYWRLFFESNSSDNSTQSCSCAELEFRAAIDGANAATGGTAIGDSELSGSFLFGAAFDSNNTTFWVSANSAPGTHWIGYDFGAGNELEIIEAAYRQRPDASGVDEALANGRIDYSDDGINWNTAWFITTPKTWTTTSEQRVFTLPIVSSVATGWRLACTRNFDNNVITTFSAAEIEFRGTTGGVDLTTGGTALADTGATAANAFDNNSGTSWSSTNVTPGGHWIGYTFPSAVSIAEVAFTSVGTAAGRDAAFVEGRLDYTNDGINWITSMQLTSARTWTTTQATRVLEAFAFRADITVPNANITADMANYPMYINLPNLHATFWDFVNEDGSNIRVYDSAGTTLIPHYVVWVDRIAKIGSVFAKQTLSSTVDTSFVLRVDTSLTAPLAVADANGRNAVWADYETVHTMGVDIRSNTGKGDLNTIGDPNTFSRITTSTAIVAHQGVAYDRSTGDYVAIDTGSLRRYNSSFVLQDTNATAPAEVDTALGVTGYDHFGDGYIDENTGYLHVIINDFVGSGNNPTKVAYAIFDTRAAGIPIVSAFDIKAGTTTELSGVCEKDGEVIGIQWPTASQLYRIDKTTGMSIGTIPLATSIAQAQAITYWRGSFWVQSDDVDEILKISADGSYVSDIGLFGTSVSGGNAEGIDWKDEKTLLRHIDLTGSSDGRVEEWTPVTSIVSGGITTTTGNAGGNSTGLASFSTFTMSCFARPSVLAGSNRVALSYRNLAAGNTNTRVVIAYRESANVWAMWDNVNSWQNSTTTPLIDTNHKLDVVYNGTTDRVIYVNGAADGTDTTVSTIPSNLDTLSLCFEDTSFFELFRGTVGYAYLRGSILPASWLSAEYQNLNTPNTFYNIV